MKYNDAIIQTSVAVLAKSRPELALLFQVASYIFDKHKNNNIVEILDKRITGYIVKLSKEKKSNKELEIRLHETLSILIAIGEL